MTDLLMPTVEAVPEFKAWLDAEPIASEEATRAIWNQAHCWRDPDGQHIWFAHVCMDGAWAESVLVFGRPLGWKGNGGGWCATNEPPAALTVAPSVSCDVCGLHATFENGSFGPGRLGRTRCEFDHPHPDHPCGRKSKADRGCVNYTARKQSPLSAEPEDDHCVNCGQVKALHDG